MVALKVVYKFFFRVKKTSAEILHTKKTEDPGMDALEIMVVTPCETA